MMGCLASYLPNYYANLDRRSCALLLGLSNAWLAGSPPPPYTPRKGLKTNQWSRPCLLVTEQETQHTAYSSVLRRKDEVSPAPVAGSQSAWSTVGRSSPFGGRGQRPFQNLQACPPLGGGRNSTHARAAGKCSCRGAAEGQLTVLSHTGVQDWTPA
ncbi:unnamed protein product [Arctogadus glacialis]